MTPYVDSEVGRLRTVILHRPGRELKRLTPRNNDELLFDGVPWVERAQAEHDAFAERLRERDVEVLYLHEELPVRGGLVDAMTDAQEFIVRPLPNLLFTRDSSVWLPGGVAIGRLALPARQRESSITAAIYRHHPRFAGTEILYGAGDDDAWL